MMRSAVLAATALCAVILFSGCGSPDTWTATCVDTDEDVLVFVLSGWVKGGPRMQAVVEGRCIGFITVGDDPHWKGRHGFYSTEIPVSGLAPGEYVVRWPPGLNLDLHAQAKEKWIELQGKVSYFASYNAIGGEAPPAGYMVNDFMLMPGKGGARAAFADYVGKYVRVRGRRSSVSYGGVETPGGSLRALIVERIERVR